MMSRTRRSFSGKPVGVFLLLLMLASLLIVVTPTTRVAYGLDDVTATLTEWTIPTAGSLPTGLALDPSGNCCWFVESSGNKVAHLDPADNTLREWAIPTPDSKPTSLALTTISGSLAVLGTESAKNKVFLFFPSTGKFKEYTLPTDSGPQHISVEPTGTQIRAWSTKLEGNSIAEIVYDPNTGTARVYELTLPAAAGGGAKGVYASSGIIWFAGISAIVKWDRAASQFTTWAIPSHPSTQTASLDVDTLGQVWYISTSPGSTSTNNYVGVLRSDNTFTEWRVPTIGADVRGVSINPVTQNPWVSEYGEDKIAKLDPSSGGIVTSSRPTATRFEPATGALFTHVAGPILPSTVVVAPASSRLEMLSNEQFVEWTLATGSRPHDVVVDASGDVWILESSANKVARLSMMSDFVIECDPSSLTVVQSANGTSTCTVTSIDGFASAVELAGSWLGTEPRGVAYTLPTPITPPPGRGVSSTLIISAGPGASVGMFTFRVTGTSGSLIRSADLEVTIAAGVADFAITVSPSYLSIPPGGSAASTIMVQSLGVFFSSVNLTSSGAPDDMTLLFERNPVTPLIGGTASSTVTVRVSGAPTGTYTLAITGSSESLTHSTTLTVQIAGGGPCLIATATYGSELTDQVQFLRNFRDKSIMRTNLGSNFVVAFNAVYYLFSPTVAQFIREHQTVRTSVKFVLYPVMGILGIGASVFDLFPMNHEAGAIASGLLVSSLIGVVYLAGPLTVVLTYSSRTRRIAKRAQVPIVIVLLSALAAAVFITALGAPAIVTIVATSAIVLSSLAASALFASQAIVNTLDMRRRSCGCYGEATTTDCGTN
ncbi:MAG: CFI-box-CTERM domain-containing protein [Candidatus Bathyarchaeia archaeon]